MSAESVDEVVSWGALSAGGVVPFRAVVGELAVGQSAL